LSVVISLSCKGQFNDVEKTYKNEITITNIDSGDLFYFEIRKGGGSGYISAVEKIKGNKKEYGIIIELSYISFNNSIYDTKIYVNYDELESLINAIDYISDEKNLGSDFKGYNETTYTTKEGLRISTFFDSKKKERKYSIRNASSISSEAILLFDDKSILTEFKEIIIKNKLKIEKIKKVIF